MGDKNKTTSTTPATTTTPGSAPTPATASSNYYVTLGIEANHPDGFDGKTAYPGIDPGHAFFSLAKDDRIVFWFSFGPAQDMRVHGSTVRGTIGYGIGEKSEHFRIKITKAVAEKLEKKSKEFRSKVLSGEQKYDITNNDTCASMVIAVLTDSGVKVPNGKSPVDVGGTGDWKADVAIFLFDFKNPFKWLQQLKDKYSTSPFIYAPSGIRNINDPFKKLNSPWMLAEGDSDPFYGRTEHEDQSAGKF